MLDVIGRLVERDNLKEVNKDGVVMRLIDIVLEDLECVDYIIQWLLYILILHDLKIGILLKKLWFSCFVVDYSFKVFKCHFFPKYGCRIFFYCSHVVSAQRSDVNRFIGPFSYKTSWIREWRKLIWMKDSTPISPTSSLTFKTTPKTLLELDCPLNISNFWIKLTCKPQSNIYSS